MEDPLVKLLDQSEIRDRLERRGRWKNRRRSLSGFVWNHTNRLCDRNGRNNFRRIIPWRTKERIERAYQSLKTDPRIPCLLPRGWKKDH